MPSNQNKIDKKIIKKFRNVHLPHSIKSVFQSWSNPILVTVFWTLPIEVTITEPKEIPINVVHTPMEIQVGLTLFKIEIGPINMKDMIKLTLLKTERIPGFDIRSQGWKMKKNWKFDYQSKQDCKFQSTARDNFDKIRQTWKMDKIEKMDKIVWTKWKICQNWKMDKIENWSKLKNGQNGRLEKFDNWTKLTKGERRRTK